jgi:hypothetical protein
MSLPLPFSDAPRKRKSDDDMSQQIKERAESQAASEEMSSAVRKILLEHRQSKAGRVENPIKQRKRSLQGVHYVRREDR